MTQRLIQRSVAVGSDDRVYLALHHTRTARRPVLNQQGLPTGKTEAVPVRRTQVISLRRMMQREVMQAQGLTSGRAWRRWYKANRAAFEAQLQQLEAATFAESQKGT